MTKTLAGRLANQRGETLAETLVSLLIAGLSLLMLTSAVASVSRIALRARRVAQDYCAVSNELASMSDKKTETSTSDKKTETSTGTVKVSEENLTNSTYTIDSVTYTHTTADSPLPGGKSAVTYRAPQAAVPEEGDEP